MSLDTALLIVTWVAMVLLYLAFARVVYEVRAQRHLLEHLMATASPTAKSAIRMPAGVTEGTDVVLAADSSCPACWEALTGLARSNLGDRAVLLTYEDESQWAPYAGRVRVIRDESAWEAVVAFSPPVLMRLGPGSEGTVEDVVLPVNADDVTTALQKWNLLRTGVGQ